MSEFQKYPGDKKTFDLNYLKIFGKKCPKCMGSGIIDSKNCPNCNGNGYVEKKH